MATIICTIIIKIISNLYLSHRRKIDFAYLFARTCALLKMFRPYFTRKFLTLIFETLIDTGRNWSPKLRSRNQIKDRFLIIHLTLKLLTYILLCMYVKHAYFWQLRFKNKKYTFNDRFINKWWNYGPRKMRDNFI